MYVKLTEHHYEVTSTVCNKMSVRALIQRTIIPFGCKDSTYRNLQSNDSLSLAPPKACKYTSHNVRMIRKASRNIRTKTLKIIFLSSPPMTSAQYQSSKPAWGQFYQSLATPVYKAAVFYRLHYIS
jgi:hypothetical protein